MDVDRGGEIYLIHGVSFLRALLSASQTGCSLMGLKKTNAAFAALVFFGTHYIITTFTLKCYWIFCQMYCQLYAFFPLYLHKKLAVFQIYAILNLNVILRKEYHDQTFL